MSNEIDNEEIMPIQPSEKIVRDPVLIHKNKIYKRVPFKREADMLHYLSRYRKLLNRVFGDETIILPIEKVIGVNNKVITDGLLLKVKEGGMEIWIMEIEMLRHGVKSHIKDQLNKINDAIKEVNPWNLAANIYSELRRDRYKFNKIREKVLGARKNSDDIIPEIKKAIDGSSKNILLIIDRINRELIDTVEDMKKSNKNVEVVIMQRYVNIDGDPTDIENEIILLTPMKGSEVDRKKIYVKSYTKRKMDKYWNYVLKIVRRFGNDVRRREYKKVRYYVAYRNGKPFLLMRKMRKKGKVELWIDGDIVTEDVRRKFQIPNRIVLTGRGRIYKRILGDDVWAKAVNFQSDEVPLKTLENLLHEIFQEESSSVKRGPQESGEPDPHDQQHEHSSKPSLRYPEDQLEM